MYMGVDEFCSRGKCIDVSNLLWQTILNNDSMTGSSMTHKKAVCFVEISVYKSLLFAVLTGIEYYNCNSRYCQLSVSLSHAVSSFTYKF